MEEIIITQVFQCYIVIKFNDEARLYNGNTEILGHAQGRHSNFSGYLIG